jgi:hypothetical protein
VLLRTPRLPLKRHLEMSLGASLDAIQRLKE